jgi:hypothetical protein
MSDTTGKTIARKVNMSPHFLRGDDECGAGRNCIRIPRGGLGWVGLLTLSVEDVEAAPITV